jgi:hypothetical protein
MKRLLLNARPLALLLIWLLPATAHAQRRFELADIGRLVNVSDPQLSPDGQQILIVVSRPNLVANRHEAEVVLVDVASGRQRVLIAGQPTVKQPRWSPTGRQVAFLARPARAGTRTRSYSCRPFPLRPKSLPTPCAVPSGTACGWYGSTSTWGATNRYP